MLSRGLKQRVVGAWRVQRTTGAVLGASIGPNGALCAPFGARGRTHSKVMDDRMQYKWFLLVAAFGTMVYVNVVGRIQDQDHSRNLERYKKNFTPQEWDDYISQIERKTMLLDSGEECYMMPGGASAKTAATLISKLGEAELLDLNELVRYQLETPSAKYHHVLKDNLEREVKGSGLHYAFTYKLRPGLFTQLVHDAIKAAKERDPSLGRFVVLNYPPTVKEAVKFEQNVTTNDFVVSEGNDDSDIVQYFQTVDKVFVLNKMPTKETLRVDPKAKAKPSQVAEPKLSPAPLRPSLDVPPPADASALHVAQYKLRQRGEPIRRYGESDADVVARLASLDV